MADRRLLATFGGWTLLLSVPLLVLAWLLLHPDLNAILALPTHHFYIVTAVHLISLGLALTVASTAVKMREFRVLFLSMGFMTMSGFFAIHGLSTPGFLMPVLKGYSGSVAGLSGVQSLLFAALLFAASATPLPLCIRRQTRGVALALVGGIILLLGAYGATAFIWPEVYSQMPISFPWGSYVTAGASILLLGFASWRNFDAYTVTRLPVQWALVTGFVLLMQAQLSMVISPTWSLAWWEYHFLMLLAAGSAMAGLLIQYRRAGSLRKIMEGVFGLENLVQIELAHGETIAALAAATEAKDLYTRGHTVRVAEKAVALGKALRLPNEKLRVLARAGLLHDIGKLGIPDSILLKPGPLTNEEFLAVKEHPRLGLEILERVGSLEREIKAIRGHHERMDGKGYPDGLAGDQIPIEARVLAVADVCDSLSVDRPYRKAMPMQRVRATLQREAGSHLDSQVVDVCLTMCPRNTPAEEAGQCAGTGGLDHAQLISQKS